MMVAWHYYYLGVRAINIFYETVPYDKLLTKINEDPILQGLARCI